MNEVMTIIYYQKVLTMIKDTDYDLEIDDEHFKFYYQKKLLLFKKSIVPIYYFLKGTSFEYQEASQYR